MTEKKVGKYGYHLFAYYVARDDSKLVVEFFERDQKVELENRIRELLLGKDIGLLGDSFSEEDIHVIYGHRKLFTTTKEVVTEVELKDE